MARSTGLLALATLLLTAPLFAADAPALFKAKCAACHGADGSGNTPVGTKLGVKNLGSADVQKHTDAELLKTISDGKDKMPPFGKKLAADELKALVAHIRTLKK